MDTCAANNDETACSAAAPCSWKAGAAKCGARALATCSAVAFGADDDDAAMTTACAGAGACTYNASTATCEATAKHICAAHADDVACDDNGADSVCEYTAAPSVCEANVNATALCAGAALDQTAEAACSAAAGGGGKCAFKNAVTAKVDGVPESCTAAATRVTTVATGPMVPALADKAASTATFKAVGLGVYSLRLVVEDGCTEVDSRIMKDIKEATVDVRCPARPSVSVTASSSAGNLRTNSHDQQFSLIVTPDAFEGGTTIALSITASAQIYSNDDARTPAVESSGVVGFEMMSITAPSGATSLTRTETTAPGGRSHTFNTVFSTKGVYIVRIRATDGCSEGERDWTIVIDDTVAGAAAAPPVAQQPVAASLTIKLDNVCDWVKLRSAAIYAIAKRSFAAKISSGAMTLTQAVSKIKLTNEPPTAGCNRRRLLHERRLSTDFDIQFEILADVGDGATVAAAYQAAADSGQIVQAVNDEVVSQGIVDAPVLTTASLVASTPAQVLAETAGCSAESVCATQSERFGVCGPLIQATSASRYLDLACVDRVSRAECSSPETECLGRCAAYKTLAVEGRCEAASTSFTDQCLSTVCGNVTDACLAQSKAAVEYTQKYAESVEREEKCRTDLAAETARAEQLEIQWTEAMGNRLAYEALKKVNESKTLQLIAYEDAIDNYKQEIDRMGREMIDRGAFIAVATLMAIFGVAAAALAFLMMKNGQMTTKQTRKDDGFTGIRTGGTPSPEVEMAEV
jgi:hypothetical protein